MATQTDAGKKQLTIIIVVSVLAVVVPYVMFFTGIGIPKGTKNKGIMIEEPVSVINYTFATQSGVQWNLETAEPKFRLLFILDGECDDVCREQLYVTRQVRTRLSKEKDQLARYVINVGAPVTEEFATFLEEQHPQLQLLEGNKQEWQSTLTAKPELNGDLNGHEYYLLHRYGALVMAYNQQHTGNELLSDLKFLIKTSN